MIFELADRQTDVLITILRTSPGAKQKVTFNQCSRKRVQQLKNT